jgi:nucleotide-binding universal stress UspA family protein
VLVARLPSLREVLLAVDGSEASGAATDIVARWPVFEATPIRVLSIATAIPAYGDPPAGSGMREVVEMARHQRVADAATRQLLDAGRTAVPYARSGDAAARIVGFAQSHGVDLIVVGSRERTGLHRALLGSVGQAVLSSTTTSVLVVRANR